MENSQDLYRVIKTARTEVEINMAAQDGFYPLLKKVDPNPEIRSKFAVFQHKKSFEIFISNDYRFVPSLSDFNCVIRWTEYYPYTQLNPFAAYLIPSDIRVGERVYVTDVIEDLVGQRWNQGSVFRLESCEAVWNGEDLELDYDPNRDSYEVLG